MEKLIDVVNKLQAVFSSTNIGDLNKEIQLPQIVVIGAQSAGKSSVLEGIVGKDFLPRGTGIVTRRPLILHLNFCATDDPFRSNFLEVEPETDFAIFEHVGLDTVFVDFDEVCNEIAEDTDRVAGDNKGICSKPIILSIYSHKLIKLSLVDLPGIIKVPIGDQPLDIETQIRNMLMEYIDNPNSIILAVTAANQDFATSEAIKLAQEVDPNGERTLAVLTKLDLMDKGTDAMKELTGKVIPIKRGIVGVINRSQADIVAKKEIEDCWEYERNFLHQNYRSIAHRNGIKYLAGILHKMLMEHIYLCLPDLKARIEENIEKCEKEMEQLGEMVKDPQAKFYDLVKRFVGAYNNAIIGSGMNTTKCSKISDELFGGAKISWIFYSEYRNDLFGLSLNRELKTENIYKAKLQAEGLHPSIIVPEKCFESLSSEQIQRLEKPSLKCVDRVHDEMKKAIGYCDAELLREFYRFPSFAGGVRNFVLRMLDERAKETKKFIQKSIGSHEKFINIKHPAFSSERAMLMMLMKMEPNISTMAQQQASRDSNSYGAKLLNDIKKADNEVREKYEGEITQKMSEREWENCVLISRLVRAYFKIVREAVQDQTIKEIYSEMIYYVKENLHNELIIHLLKKSSDLNALFQEDEGITQKRIEAENRLETLQKADAVLNEMDDINYAF